MPDGILLFPGAELKYINTVPHSDHCSWLPIAIGAYLHETGRLRVLAAAGGLCRRAGTAPTVFEHVCRGLRWLLRDRSPRGLSRIWQGDWNDPMNMVGPQGRGESAMLSQSLAYGLRLWAEFGAMAGAGPVARRLAGEARRLNDLINRHYWDGRWYARGYTDEGRNFGVRSDREGKIFLNAQTFALLCGAATGRRARVHPRGGKTPGTEYGPLILAPAFTRMCENVGRMTQKHAGSDVNGSVYSHAAAFYIFALYEAGRGDLHSAISAGCCRDRRKTPCGHRSSSPFIFPTTTAATSSRGRPAHRATCPIPARPTGSTAASSSSCSVCRGRRRGCWSARNCRPRGNRLRPAAFTAQRSTWSIAARQTPRTGRPGQRPRSPRRADFRHPQRKGIRSKSCCPWARMAAAANK